ncbi:MULTISPECIES: YqgE/AlgH family protein [unclassified Methylophilus]|jgi:putative transcriptional regulator|uniref:YqgE/AlgH family protein n=1 Tax=unclassified Methylophilus TaxID=2630143 RepID=UPI00188F71C2|nr:MULTISPECIES: YqgE/AlgH family protein [unclassified Methylophilus]MBF5039183.1 YqgE/AlgH family protein [Methylophilus sp. 13]MDF0377346.1 YqgE/AlgH family protein [Methylophilus sp. YYY-1]BEV08624.1 YqgE/AlgH family protein [Methylophilus sp. DW102]
MSEQLTLNDQTSRLDLTGQILIAMPAMQDPYFSKSVILICNHDEDGAMGMILNHPLQLNVGDLFEQLEMECHVAQQQARPVHFGGPVQVERGFVLHAPATEFNTTMGLSDRLAMTSSKDILEAAARDEAPQDMFIALGYTGWAAGQLEQEIQANAWLTLPLADHHQLHKLIFKLPSDDKLFWAMQQLGVDFATLSEVAGHA